MASWVNVNILKIRRNKPSVTNVHFLGGMQKSGYADTSTWITTYCSFYHARSSIIHSVTVVWAQTLQVLLQMELDGLPADLQSYSVAWAGIKMY